MIHIWDQVIQLSHMVKSRTASIHFVREIGTFISRLTISKAVTYVMQTKLCQCNP
jgi:hypothetical protein